MLINIPGNYGICALLPSYRDILLEMQVIILMALV